MVADEICKRIETLVANYLDVLGVDASGWDTLYRDPNDSRLWELVHPQSELSGGGPPELPSPTAPLTLLHRVHSAHSRQCTAHVDRDATTAALRQKYEALRDQHR
ncbi:MAG: hypothetical protein HYX38_01410 [Rhodospirillales bacterium]|nr:hypothetical protein [Rhodospirillales bacterium]